jgi:hypothetical protein
VIGSSILTSEAAIAAGFFGVTIYPGNQLCLTTSDAVHPSTWFSLKRAGCLRFDPHTAALQRMCRFLSIETAQARNLCKTLHYIAAYVFQCAKNAVHAVN